MGRVSCVGVLVCCLGFVPGLFPLVVAQTDEKQPECASNPLSPHVSWLLQACMSNLCFGIDRFVTSLFVSDTLELTCN